MNKAEKQMMWAYLIHVGYNMWYEREAGFGQLSDGFAEDYCTASDTLRFDLDIWHELTGSMVNAGINTLVIDLGEGIQYDSHPEIAVKGSLDKDTLSRELRELRCKGITPVPKLNFSAAHDEWMGKYSNCVSSQEYYGFCRDLINEVTDLFDNPPYFHIGMDEETYDHQKKYGYAVVRRGEQWWHDLYYLIELVEKKGPCPWIWSDYIWNNEAEFICKMPREVLQSNWYYDRMFNIDNPCVRAYSLLSEHGFTQVPAGSNWSCQWNFEGVVNYCRKNCNPESVIGFLQTVWRPTVRDVKYRHLEAVDIVRKVRLDFEARR